MERKRMRENQRTGALPKPFHAFCVLTLLFSLRLYLPLPPLVPFSASLRLSMHDTPTCPAFRATPPPVPPLTSPSCQTAHATWPLKPSSTWVLLRSQHTTTCDAAEDARQELRRGRKSQNRRARVQNANAKVRRRNFLIPFLY